MPLQNRVTPLGELVATPERGLVFGNRGRLHDDEGRIRRRFDGRRWIACRLEFRGRHRRAMPPGRYTGLFFLDEATAFAAGHRPCAECRHEDYVRFVAIVGARADAIDGRLHEERLGPRRTAPLDGLPDGTFVLREDAPWLVLGGELLRWTPGGYRERVPRPGARATIVTPPLLLEVLRAGWSGAVPFLHPSAGVGPAI
ncbi:MAG: hypothetical protein JOZ56_07715 [Actinobacteria bacterium]|nr:hypothetical protein [Actinomycetota bacterium]